MILQEIPEPDDVLIVGIEAEPDQGVNDAAHMHWLRTLVGFLKLLLDHIAGKGSIFPPFWMNSFRLNRLFAGLIT